MRAAPALAALCVAASAVLAAGAPDGLGDPHLPLVPRTDAEAAQIAGVLAPPQDYTVAEPHEALPGGSATLRGSFGRDAFSQPSAGLDAAGLEDFSLGNVLFRKLWVAAPASTRGSDGLGPLYNARSCEACHRRDGRGAVPDAAGAAAKGLLLRLSLPGGSAPPGIPEFIATLPDPVYGDQLQDAAAPGQIAEGRLVVDYSEHTMTLADATTVVLRTPTYRIADPAFGTTDDGLMISPRLAPPMIGLGLLEAIPAADILSRADPGDADGDGISGRVNIVESAEFGQPMLGRFGWKAGQPTIRAQTAAALSADMGLSNPLHPAPWGDCSAAEAACRAGPHGQEPGARDGLELDGASLDLLAFYSRNLAVPERRAAATAAVLRGKAVFADAGCPACHVPKFVTARLEGRPEQSFQLIWPYTDLLLHDMGDGLADNRPEARATGREWRTPPLWGIGLTATVSERPAYLHDGRARNLLEAILWHGGEAAAARDRVIGLSPQDRSDLMTFLESL